MENNPLSIILVENGTKGDRLLFRYPYEVQRSVSAKITSGEPAKRKNPFSVVISEDLNNTPPSLSASSGSSLCDFPSKVMSNLFAVKSVLCDTKFELKINDIRFVGHPLLLQNSSKPMTRSEDSSIILFNIVFALKATASHSVVDCYHQLSQKLAIAIRHEENRCEYLTQEAKTMTLAQDEVAMSPKDHQESPFSLILQRSQLARDLKLVYESLCGTGYVQLRINRWIEISFCLPQKVHQLHHPCSQIEPRAIYDCLKALRPYHAVLLLFDKEEVLSRLPLDASSALKRLITISSPLKSLQTLAADADLTLAHVFQLVGHLLYWAMATVIYPLCDSNEYVISPTAPISPNSSLAKKFAEKFRGYNFVHMLSDFSMPATLSQKRHPMDSPRQQAELVQIVVWLLQHRILMQLHTYVHLMVDSSNTPPVAKRSPKKVAIKVTPSVSSSRGSRQSSPDDLSTPSELVRIPSDSDMASVASDDLTASPPASQVLSEKNIRLVDLSEKECEAVLAVPAASEPEDLRLFARLCPYFVGLHHLEEIMYFENVRRSQLLQLLDKFRSVLVTYKHEDAASATFYKYWNSD